MYKHNKQYINHTCNPFFKFLEDNLLEINNKVIYSFIIFTRIVQLFYSITGRKSLI